MKICGLTRAADAQFAEREGADYLGVIFAGGVRMLSESSAQAVLAGDAAGIGVSSHRARRVGVFGRQPATEIARIAGTLSLDVIQLHGDPDLAIITTLQAMTACAIWPVLRVDASGITPTLDGHARALGASTGWLALDTKVDDVLGGSGRAFDWAAVGAAVAQWRAAVPDLRVVLAGGLRATNVREAIRVLAPDVVDVSSGVERAPGVKDHEAVRAFIRAARNEDTGT